MDELDQAERLLSRPDLSNMKAVPGLLAAALASGRTPSPRQIHRIQVLLDHAAALRQGVWRERAGGGYAASGTWESGTAAPRVSVEG
ncbi:MAG: hypothetical protein FJW39_34870 [Acidobacteria bacterium]|nr:hypothetical protein [Acidobacteriota bacterium]